MSNKWQLHPENEDCRTLEKAERRCDGKDSAVSPLAYGVWLTLGLVVAVTLLTLFSQERQLLEDGVSQWGRQMPILAVLRDEIDDAGARRFADQLTSHVPGLECTLIDRRQAKSLLALQEPWMRQLPDMLISELPALLEIRHPALFHSAQQLDDFLAFLQSQREVDFVIFNAIGHDRVVDALARTRRHADTLLVSASAGILMLLSCYIYHLIRRRGGWNLARIVGVDVLAWGGAGILSIGILMGISRFGLGQSTSVHLFFWGLATLASGTVIVMLELILNRWRRS